jgi:hypothetical protein
MLSALGPSFATSFSTIWSELGHAIGPYILLTVGLVLAIIVIGFVMHYMQKQIVNSAYSDAQAEDNDRYWNDRLGGDKY